jgi:uncharacterized membrane protein
LASNKAILLVYSGASMGGLVLTAGALWLTRTLPWRTRARIRALVMAASFMPSIIIYSLFLHGVVSFPEIAAFGSTVFTYVLLFGAIPIVLIWAAIRRSWPKNRQR